ncbi:integrase catalytic domain-containing protein, partial [Trichonephila clavata]
LSTVSDNNESYSPDLALEYNKKHNEKQSQITDLTTYLRGEVESRERTENLLKPHGSTRIPINIRKSTTDLSAANRKGQGHSRFYPSHKSGLDSSLVAVETSLGWSLQGKCDEQSDCTSVHLIHSEEESISAELRRFWEIESLGIRDNDSVSLGNGDEEILSEFDKSVCFVDGRYRVSLPWKPGMREFYRIIKLLHVNVLRQQEGVETEFSETSATDLKPPIKVLGLAWDSEKDLIYFDPKDLLKFMSRKTESKRFILSVVGRIFDPIGILGPFVIKLKCLLQDLWTLGVDWDSELPPKLRHKWQQWSSEAAVE